MKVFQKCYEQGLLLRSSADYLVISPALIAQEDQIIEIGETLKSVINQF
jgi:adenosylmethionine-8-amino-7-oxononanoate aminotransferase